MCIATRACVTFVLQGGYIDRSGPIGQLDVESLEGVLVTGGIGLGAWGRVIWG